MRNFWDNQKHAFHRLPESGRFNFEHFFLALIFIATMFVGIGQVPVSYVILTEQASVSGDTADVLMSLSLIIGKNKLLILLLIPFILTFLAFLFALRYIHKTAILPFFTSRPSFDWKRVFFAFGLWFSLMLLSLIYALFSTDFYQWNYNPKSFLGLLIIALLIVPIQILCEELLFRSYFFKSLSFLKKPLLQVFLTAVLFGFMHMGNPEISKLGYGAIVFYIWTGVFLGLITHFDNGIELATGYHAANNIFGAVIVTTNWQAFQTDALWMDTAEPTLGWEILLTLFLWQPLLFILFNWRYNWGIGKK